MLFLGTGVSEMIPHPMCGCEVCRRALRSSDPREKRCRSAMLLDGDGQTAATRRKPVLGGILSLRVDWLLLRGIRLHSCRVLSTQKSAIQFAAPEFFLDRFLGTELSDHNVVFARCCLP